MGDDGSPKLFQFIPRVTWICVNSMTINPKVVEIFESGSKCQMAKMPSWVPASE